MHIVPDAAQVLEKGERPLEAGGVDAHDRAAEHLDEAAVGVPGEAFVAGDLGKPEDGVVVEADVEDRLHHAGHGELRAGADGQQQRVVRLPQRTAGGGFEARQVRGDLLPQARGFAARLQEGAARLGGDGESRRHGEPEPGHLRQVRSLAAEEIGHVTAALGEVVHVTDHDAALLKRWGVMTPASDGGGPDARCRPSRVRDRSAPDEPLPCRKDHRRPAGAVRPVDHRHGRAEARSHRISTTREGTRHAARHRGGDRRIDRRTGRRTLGGTGGSAARNRTRRDPRLAPPRPTRAVCPHGQHRARVGRAAPG